MAAERKSNVSATAKAYVREMLELNPMWQSAVILKRRRELWGGESPVEQAKAKRVALAAVQSTSDASEDEADRRREQRAHRCLETLQKQFYSLSEDKLHEHIRFLQHDRLPEFAARANRLAKVAPYRQELLGTQEETGDRKFAYSLLHGVIGTGAQAGSLKEQYIESIIAERRVKASCKMVRRFIEQHPAIYELERDWFDLFLDKQNQKQWITQYSFRGPGANLRRYSRSAVVVIGVVVVFIIAALLEQPSNTPRNSRPGTTPSRTYDAAGRQHSEMMSRIRKRLVTPQPSVGAPTSIPNPNSIPQYRPSWETPPAKSDDGLFPSGSDLSTQDEIMERFRQSSGLPAQPRLPSALEQIEELQKSLRTPRQATPKFPAPRFMDTTPPRLPSFSPGTLP